MAVLDDDMVVCGLCALHLNHKQEPRFSTLLQLQKCQVQLEFVSMTR
jgi:hypothetical protein